MKKALCLITAALLLLLAGQAAPAAEAEVILLPEEVLTNAWYQDARSRLKVGNPTPLRGQFFTTMWGGTTSDLDVQDLLHAYSPVLWDSELGRFRFDRSVVQDAAILNNGDGSRTYMLVLADDLRWSDGTPVTARDYAFSLLLQMDPAVEETGGKTEDCSWLAGSDAYLSGEAGTVSGLRIISDQILQITVKAEALPYFYELNRLNVRPYPAEEIAPGTKAADDGKGAYLTRPLTAEILQENVLDGKLGYMSHPRVVSGPYVLASFDGTTAKLALNPYYKGNEKGMVPRIGVIEYRRADNADMITKLKYGDFDLLNKVTKADSVRSGIRTVQADTGSFAMDNEARTGLTLVWFAENSAKTQELVVRRAIAYCFDRETFTKDYTGSSGTPVDGLYGPGQWTYRKAAEEKEQGGASLDGLTRYRLNTAEAVRLLEEAGWSLNEAGEPFDPQKDRVRCRKNGEEMTALTLTMALPVNDDARQALNKTLTAHLREAGIALTLVPVNMDTLQDAYEGRTDSTYDMLYLGDNFRIVFDPEIFAVRTDGTELGAVRKEALGLARDMVRTEPEDVTGYLRKWVKLQEKITETLPLIPVYSNTYFDFFTRKLHDYRITDSATWGGAIVSAYMSDMEVLTDEEKKNIEKELEELLSR